MATTTTSQIDPTIQPFLTYGLTEAQKLYQGGGPQYYGGQTYVSPSETTQTGLQALEQRAKLGNPLLQSAQGQLQNTISGGFLQGNPFFQGFAREVDNHAVFALLPRGNILCDGGFKN